MKKFSILLVAMMLVTVSFAQLQIPANAFKAKGMVSNMKPIYDQQQRADYGWLSYADILFTNVGHQVDPNTDDAFNYLQSDSLGLVFFHDENNPELVTGSMSPWIHGTGMVYDFTHDNYQNVAEEGEVSLTYSPVLKLDSLAIKGAYFRGANTPANCVDTLIVGVLTSFDNVSVMGGGYYDENHEFHAYYKFHDIELDFNTLMPVGASIIKLPLTDADVCWDSAGYFRFQGFDLAINQGNITDQLLYVMYTFKRGYDINVNDDLAEHSHFFGRWWKDYRQAYYPYYNSEVTGAADWQTCSNDFVNNFNKGYYLSTDSRYDLMEDGYVGYHAYTPSFTQKTIHYPDMYLKMSCTDCAYTSVEDMEKENITVYPNPTNSVLNVKLAGEKEANIQLFNLVGQQVYNGTAMNTASINVSNMKAGVYMLRVNNHTTKVVVK